MAGRGNTIPKDPARRRRANKTADSHVVAADGEKRGPDLPFGIEWHAQTRIWWDNWCGSAQSQTFTTTDWDFLLDTALLHTLYWSGRTDVAAELRLRVAKMGATLGDRQTLRLQIGEVDQAGVKAGERTKPSPPNVARLEDRRKRLAGA